MFKVFYRFRLLLLVAATTSQAATQNTGQDRSQRAAENLTAVTELLDLAYSAFDRASLGVTAVDPSDPDAIIQAMDDWLIADATLEFLSIATDAFWASVAPGQAVDGESDEASQELLDNADYHLILARNNLGPEMDLQGMTSEPGDPEPIEEPVAGDDGGFEGHDDSANDDAGEYLDPAGPPKTPTTVKGPDGSDGPAVPPGATGSPTDNNKGLRYPLKPTAGLDPRVVEIRIMDPMNIYINFYYVHMNKGGQAVNPRTGKTTSGNSDPWGHIPLDK